MDMVVGDSASDDFCVVFLANTPDVASDFQGDVANQNRIAILGYPDDMVIAIIGGMGGFAVILHMPPS